MYSFLQVQAVLKNKRLTKDIYSRPKQTLPEQSGVFKYFLVQNNDASQKNAKKILYQNSKIVRWDSTA